MLPEHDMRVLAPSICRILEIDIPKNAETADLREMVEDLEGVKRLTVIVEDAFGVSTWEKAWDYSPFFNTLSAFHYTHIRSVMPSITPVNFATMLTGASPEAHQIKDRTEKLELETIFDTLRADGKFSGTAARRLSSLGILISPHADNPGIALSNTDQEVREIACNQLNKHYDLVWVQLLDIDNASHKNGPYSLEAMKAVKRADNNLRLIVETAYKEGYGVISLADHGQHSITKDERARKPVGIEGTHGTDSYEDTTVPLVWCNQEDLRRIFAN
jgi:predicted AlkP superfamily pyrophosphatase or phosphodiesterase